MELVRILDCEASLFGVKNLHWSSLNMLIYTCLQDQLVYNIYNGIYWMCVAVCFVVTIVYMAKLHIR